jgi:uncharacterized membrane protein
MASRFKLPRPDKRSTPRRVWRARAIRPVLERLEDRILLDASLPPDIVVGRTLSSYTAGGIQNNQETITYTVYNEQANPVTGVLLTDTLAPGEKVVSASQPPDQSGQNLAWSLGTIQGNDRASVTLTISLPGTIPSQLDTGAKAFAMLGGASVSCSTPAATLRQGNVDPGLLASTPDANTTDPYIQEEAAALKYDPQQIFNFLQNNVGYNSYLGSVRGARGTLWSNSGNSLDVSSLGVALLRASGIPAQYAEGTLSQGQAQQLILSMFPASYQTEGYIPAGTQTSDPANDPQLLSETEQHFWFQFDTGSGMKDADPLIAGATLGQRFTTSTGTFTEVPDNLREKTEVSLTAEVFSQAGAAFGVGNGLSDTVVLDQTFNDVDLVGHPLTIGNFVSSSSTGFLLTSTVNTYEPYIAVGDDANPEPGQNEVIHGKSFEDVFTNFPLGSQLVTGLFLDVTLSGPQGAPQTYEKTLYDGIGFAARQGAAPVSVSVNPSGGPTLSPLDVWSIDVLPGRQEPTTALGLATAVQVTQDTLNTELAANDTTGATATFANLLGLQTRVDLESLLTASSVMTMGLAGESLVAAYNDRPRITVVSAALATPTKSAATLTFETDLLDDSLRVVGSPGQAVSAPVTFRSAWGLMENVIEAQNYAQPISGGPLTVQYQASTSAVMDAARAQGIPLATLTPGNMGLLDSLSLSAQAKARITLALQAGLTVVVPSSEVTIGGKQTVAWWQINPQTGELTGVGEDGSHQALVEYGPAFAGAAVLTLGGIFVAGYIGGILDFNVNLKPKYYADYNAAFGVNTRTKGFTDNVAHDPKRPEQLKRIALDQFATQVTAEVDKLSMGGLLQKGEAAAIEAQYAGFLREINSQPGDPPVPTSLIAALPPLPSEDAQQNVPVSANAVPGTVSGSVGTSSLSTTGSLQASWNSSSGNAFQVTSLSAATATVRDASGATLGTGAVALAAGGTPVPVAVAGANAYNLTGKGNLSFYGPAESNLGVSGSWDNYSATVMGNVAITLSTSGLTLNGKALAAGMYTLTTLSASLAGSGPSSSPDLSGSASLTTTAATVNLGSAGSGVTVGGKPLGLGSGGTLGGYTGSIRVDAGGNNTDTVTLNGNAANVLTVSASPATLTADQNTPATFQAKLKTSFPDTYTVSAEGPAGWNVTVDSAGHVTVTPAAGLQGGTYPILLIAQSVTDAALIAQTTVNVTVTPTVAGVTLNVAPDPVYSVPFNGAQVPSAFAATLHNNGPAADTYHLTFSNVPAGFTVLSGETNLTIPSGQTGVVGVYLQPNGSQLPPPGTQVSFTVTATSTSNPAITATQNVSFTVPAIDAVTVTATPTAVNTTPGTPVKTSLTLTDAGNVPETVSLADTLSTGLTGSTLNPVSLAVGQSVTETLTLTPAASVPLNSLLQATVTATFGPSGAPVTQTVAIPVQVVVPGADALANAGVAAGQLGDTALANRLGDLSTALTNLVQNPTSAVYKSQALANIDSLVSQVSSDPFQAAFTPALTTARASLASATSAAGVEAAATQLRDALGTLATVLTDEAAHGYTASLSPNSATAQPGAASTFTLLLQNNGSQATTYDLGVSGLPANVRGSLNVTKVTVQPGQLNTAAQLTLTETGTSLTAAGFTLTVTPEGATELASTVPGALSLRQTFLSVTEVDATPPFTNAGPALAVSARVLNVVNQTQQALASYTVTNSTGKTVFTSASFPVTFNVQNSLTVVSLGTLPTAGLPNDTYTIHVTISDTNHNPIPGGTGEGTLLIGSPVNAGITVSNAGLQAEYFSFPNGVSSLPDLTGRTPDVTRIESQLNYPNVTGNWPGLDSRFDTNFAALYTGTLNVVAPGSYTLYLNSDDGSELTLDGQRIIDNDGDHAMQEVSDTLNLTAGSHTLQVEYFQNGGGKGLVLSWSGPGFGKEAIPAGALFQGPAVSGSSTTLPPGNGTVTNTLTVNPNPRGGVLKLLGQVAASGGTDEAVAVYPNGSQLLAYVPGTQGIDIVDVTNPSNPRVVGTFGQNDVVQGGGDAVKVVGNQLVVASQYSGINAASFQFLVYSLTNPLHPQLLGNKGFTVPYLTGMDAQGNDAYITSQGGNFTFGGLSSQFGNFSAIDFSTPTAPALSSRLSDHDSATPHVNQTQEEDVAVFNSQVAYVTSSTSTGGAAAGKTTPGEGRLLVVNIQNPAALTEYTLPDGAPGGSTELDVPGTNRLYGIGLEGNHALVAGSTGGLDNGGNVTGNVTLTVLDDTDPLNPHVVATVVTPNTITGGVKVKDLGNNLFAVTGTSLYGAPVLEIVDISDPAKPTFAGIDVPASLNGGITAANGKLYLTSTTGLSIFNIGQLVFTPVTASVDVPNGTGVSVVANSFNVAPTKIIHGTSFDTLVWSASLADTTNITWQSTVSNLQPGEVRDVTLGTTVAFVSQGTSGQIGLPPTAVTGSSSGQNLLRLSPASQTVRPAAPATYDVTVSNPTAAPVTYNLAVAGVRPGWVHLPSSVTVGPQGTSDVSLRLTSDSFAALGSYGFVVTASPPTGAEASGQGTLVLAGQPAVRPDPNAHGIVATLTPVTASAGQGTSAVYTVQLTNTGSTDDTFSLAAAGLPAGVTAKFSKTTVDVPPEASNFRNVTLILTPPVGTTAGNDPFAVTATSTTDSSVTARANGTLTVLSNGVSVTLTPSTGAPGSTFQMKVTNTGKATDTFNLALGGPAALVAKLATSQVTLAPGASQTVLITTGAVNFAEAGILNLTATATSQTNPAVTSAATSALSMPASTGLTASFTPAAQTLPVPGPALYQLQVNNTGNSEDAYTATILGTSGPITAAFIGLDGRPTQTISVFRLPGLSSGAILLQTTATSPGQGSVTIQVHSLSNNLQAPATATLTVPGTTSPPAPPPAATTGGSSSTPPGTSDNDSSQPPVTQQVVMDILLQMLLGQGTAGGMEMAMGAALLSYAGASKQSASQAGGLLMDEFFLMNDLALGYELALGGLWSTALVDAAFDMSVALNSNPLYGTPSGSGLGLWAGAAFLAADAGLGSQSPALLLALAMAAPSDTE